MEQDFSWDRSAGEYLKIYAAVTGLSPEKKSARPAAADTTDAPTASGSASASEADEKPVLPVKKSGSRKVHRKRREKTCFREEIRRKGRACQTQKERNRRKGGKVNSHDRTIYHAIVTRRADRQAGP